MRFEITYETQGFIDIPYNYNYSVHYSLCNLMKKYLSGFPDTHDHNCPFFKNGILRFFTFSNLKFNNCDRNEYGFHNVKSISLVFSSPLSDQFFPVLAEIFTQHTLILHFEKKPVRLYAENIIHLESIDITGEEKFTTLSPVVVCGKGYSPDSLNCHYLDYTKEKEKEFYVQQLHQNLLFKHNLLYNFEFDEPHEFEFEFDTEYIKRRSGNIRKNISYRLIPEKENYTHIIGMEAPFTIKTHPKLIKIGYQCGFGEHNNSGFGLVKPAR
ncbi:MAG: CRISPR-associated endoribonuclease Cas6 [Candidatus Cloacimonadota bacterium]|nr:MAG: CRISPR-associated endoribonuclease Cas6 [Candidatus Cloacimonadota bacterium]